MQLLEKVHVTPWTPQGQHNTREARFAGCIAGLSLLSRGKREQAPRSKRFALYVGATEYVRAFWRCAFSLAKIKAFVLDQTVDL
jgi:hypothetical protein